MFFWGGFRLSCVSVVKAGERAFVPLLHAVIILISLLFIVWLLSEEKGSRGRSSGSHWSVSRRSAEWAHLAQKQTWEHLSWGISPTMPLWKLTTEVKALGVTVSLTGTPRLHVEWWGVLQTLCKAKLLYFEIKIIVRTSGSISVFLTGSAKKKKKGLKSPFILLMFVLLHLTKYFHSTTVFRTLLFMKKYCTSYSTKFIWHFISLQVHIISIK